MNGKSRGFAIPSLVALLCAGAISTGIVLLPMAATSEARTILEPENGGCALCPVCGIPNPLPDGPPTIAGHKMDAPVGNYGEYKAPEHGCVPGSCWHDTCPVNFAQQPQTPEDAYALESQRHALMRLAYDGDVESAKALLASYGVLAHLDTPTSSIQVALPCDAKRIVTTIPLPAEVFASVEAGLRGEQLAAR